MIWLYRLLLNLAIPFGLIGLAIRGFKNPLYWQRIPERFGFVPHTITTNASFDLWIHAVSVGEARAAAPLVDRILRDHPNYKILVTTTTPTGSNTVTTMLGTKVAHCYFPYDLAWAMNRFISAIKPKLVLVMETEIWPNMIARVKKSNARLLYTNVRLSERSYKGYAKFPNLVASVLSQVDHFAVQGEQDQKHLELLGVASDKITQTGSIKFDVKTPASLRESAEVMRRQLGQDRLVWIAGSTREGEESRLLDCYLKLKKDLPSLLMIIVPRHPERFESVARKIQRKNLNSVRRSETAHELDKEIDVYLCDTMGELALMYASSDVAFVGGSLVPLGGQNILEPAALGIPVVFGPHMFNFPEISRITVQEGAGKMVQDDQELTAVLKELLSRPNLRDEIGNKGIAMIDKHKGALEKNYQLLDL